MNSPEQEVNAQIEEKEVFLLVQLGEYTNQPGPVIDVRNIIMKLELDRVFNVVRIKAKLRELVGETGYIPTIADGLNCLQAMAYYSYLPWSTKGGGFVFCGEYSPSELVEVARTKGPLKGRGGSYIIPRAVYESDTTYPKQDGWHIIKTFKEKAGN